jgi:hypothetical protein
MARPARHALAGNIPSSARTFFAAFGAEADVAERQHGGDLPELSGGWITEHHI